MVQNILNQRQHKLSWYRQIILAVCSVIHLYIIYNCIFVAAVESGAKNFIELFCFGVNEIKVGQYESIGSGGVLFIIVFLASSAAIIASATLYLRKNYILATEVTRGILALIICYIIAYYGFVIFASVLCFVWLMCVWQFYVNRQKAGL